MKRSNCHIFVWIKRYKANRNYTQNKQKVTKRLCLNEKIKGKTNRNETQNKQNFYSASTIFSREIFSLKSMNYNNYFIMIQCIKKDLV